MTQSLTGYREFSFDESPSPITKPLCIIPLDPVTVSTFAGEPARLICRPQRPITMRSLFIPYEMAREVTIEGVFVGVSLQLGDAGSVPGELFGWTCQHPECEGRHDQEPLSTRRPDNPIEALEMMARCIEKYPDQPRAVRVWNFEEALPGMEVVVLLRARRAPLSVHACWLGELTDTSAIGSARAMLSRRPRFGK